MRQVLHQPLADAVDLVGLSDAHGAGDHRDEDHQPGVDAHQPHVRPAAAAREEGVEDELDEDRVDDTQTGPPDYGEHQNKQETGEVYAVLRHVRSMEIGQIRRTSFSIFRPCTAKERRQRQDGGRQK